MLITHQLSFSLSPNNPTQSIQHPPRPDLVYLPRRPSPPRTSVWRVFVYMQYLVPCSLLFTAGMFKLLLLSYFTEALVALLSSSLPLSHVPHSCINISLSQQPSLPLPPSHQKSGAPLSSVQYRAEGEHKSRLCLRSTQLWLCLSALSLPCSFSYFSRYPSRLFCRDIPRDISPLSIFSSHLN